MTNAYNYLMASLGFQEHTPNANHNFNLCLFLPKISVLLMAFGNSTISISSHHIFYLLS